MVKGTQLLKNAQKTWNVKKKTTPQGGPRFIWLERGFVATSRGLVSNQSLVASLKKKGLEVGGPYFRTIRNNWAQFFLLKALCSSGGGSA